LNICNTSLLTGRHISGTYDSLNSLNARDMKCLFSYDEGKDMYRRIKMSRVLPENERMYSAKNSLAYYYRIIYDKNSLIK